MNVIDTISGESINPTQIARTVDDASIDADNAHAVGELEDHASFRLVDEVPADGESNERFWGLFDDGTGPMWFPVERAQ